MLDDSDLNLKFCYISDELKRTCFENILLKEIEIINPSYFYI